MLGNPLPTTYLIVRLLVVIPCSGQLSEKVRLAQILSNFCEIVVSEFFNSHRDYHHLF
jgi:hypothetical protein